MWIVISLFLMKPADLDLHRFQKSVMNFEKVLGTMGFLDKMYYIARECSNQPAYAVDSRKFEVQGTRYFISQYQKFEVKGK